MSVPLYISLQPEDTALVNGKATLRCEAGGGSGDYIYYWYFYDEDHMLSQSGPVVEVGEAGEYYCCAQDGSREIWSVRVTVSEETEEQAPEEDSKPVITLQPENVTLPWSKDNVYTLRLRCEATTGSGDDEILYYRWEKQGPYRWSAIQNGGRNELVITAGARGVSGVYECVVTNPRTGETTISNQVLVQVELTCENLRYELYQEPGISNKAYKLAGTIVGGVPPYQVSIYQFRPYDYEYPVVRTPIYWTQKESGDFEKKLSPIFYLMYDYVDTSHGVPEMGRSEAYYFIVIEDSADNRYESQPTKYGG